MSMFSNALANLEQIFSQLQMYMSFDFVQKALIVGPLIALCSALLGVTLVLKRFSFIGDGLSHVSFAAMVIASILGFSNDLYLVIPVTVLASLVLLGAGTRAKVKGDAAVAMVSVSSLAIGYVLMSNVSKSTNKATDVCGFLFGSGAKSILALSDSDVWLCCVMSAVVVILFVLFYHRIFAVTFDEAFAQATGVKAKAYNLLIAAVIAVVISLAMRLVGSLLISALIIFPALSAMRLFKSFRGVTICSVVLSVFCAVLGMLISIVFGTPVGSTIVMADLGCFAICFVIGLVTGK